MMLNTKYKGPPKRPASSFSTTTPKQGPSSTAVSPPLFPDAPTTTASTCNAAITTPSRPATATTSRAADTPGTAPQRRYATSTKSSSSAARAREIISVGVVAEAAASSRRESYASTFTSCSSSQGGLPLTPTPPPNSSPATNIHRKGAHPHSASDNCQTPPYNLSSNLNAEYFTDVVDGGRSSSGCVPSSSVQKHQHQSHDVSNPHQRQRNESSLFDLKPNLQHEEVDGGGGGASFARGTELSFGAIPHMQSVSCATNNTSCCDGFDTKNSNPATTQGAAVEVPKSRNGSGKSVGGFSISSIGRNSLDAGIHFQRDVRIAMSNLTNNNENIRSDEKRRTSSVVSIRNFNVSPIVIQDSHNNLPNPTTANVKPNGAVSSPQYATTSPASPSSWGTSIRGRHVEGLSPSSLPPSLFDLQDPNSSDVPPPEVRTERQRSRWESLRKRVQQTNSSSKAWDYAIYGYYYLNDDFREGGGSPGEQEGMTPTLTTGSIMDTMGSVDVSVRGQPLSGSTTSAVCGGDSSMYQSAMFRSYLSDDGFGSMARLKYSTRSSGRLFPSKSVTEDTGGMEGGGGGGPTISDIFKSVGAGDSDDDGGVCLLSQADNSPRKSTSSCRPSVHQHPPSPLIHLSSSFSRLSNRSPLFDKEKADIRKVLDTRTSIEEAQMELTKRVAMLRKERAAERRALSLQGSSTFTVQPPPRKPTQRKGQVSPSTTTTAPARKVSSPATSPFLSPRQRREKQSQIRNARERLKRASVSVRPSSPAPLGLRHPSCERHVYNRLTVQARLKRDRWWEVKAGYQVKLSEMDDVMVGRAALCIQRWLRVDLPTRRQRRLYNAARHEDRVRSYERRQRYLRAQKKWRWAFGELQTLWRTPWYKGGVQRVQAAGRRLLSQTRLIRQLTATASNPTSTFSSIACLLPGVNSVRSRTLCIVSLLKKARDTERQAVLEQERQLHASSLLQRWWRGLSAQSLSHGYFISEERRYHQRRYDVWLRGGAGIDCGLLRIAAVVSASTTNATKAVTYRNVTTSSSRHVVESYKYQFQYEAFAENTLQEAYRSCSGAPATTSSSPSPRPKLAFQNRCCPQSSTLTLFEAHKALVWQFVCANGDKWGVKRLLEKSVYAPLPIHVNAGAFVKSRRQHHARVIQNTLFRDHFYYRRCARKPLEVFLRGRVETAVLRIQKAWRRYLVYRQEYIDQWRVKNGLRFRSIL